MVSLLELVRLHDEEQAWLRQFVVPEEQRSQLTSAAWGGEYRWFLAENVVCIEKVRAVRQATLPDRTGGHRRRTP